MPTITMLIWRVTTANVTAAAAPDACVSESTSGSIGQANTFAC